MVHIALIPAYRPTEVLPGLVRQCRENGLTVVVVDDESGEEDMGFRLVIIGVILFVCAMGETNKKQIPKYFIKLLSRS